MRRVVQPNGEGYIAAAFGLYTSPLPSNTFPEVVCCFTTCSYNQKKAKQTPPIAAKLRRALICM